MLIEDKKIIFSTALVIFDDEEAMRAAQSGKYSRITIITLNRLALPGFSIREKMTGLIDLKGDLEEITAIFNKTTRNEIARTYRDADFQFETYDDVPRDIYAMYVAFTRNIGKAPFSRKALSGCAAVGGYYNGELISGTIFFRSIPTVRIRAIFSKRQNVDRGSEMYKRIGYAARRSILEVCRWGIANDCSAVDLATVHTSAGEIDTSDESYFKLSFNPRIVPQLTYIYMTQVRRFIERLYPASILSVLRGG
ncbi:hypothetical protein A2765_00450 [Candidatus Kaiserbacteria bacterium RIFCSPHIGHO2_01_FULL_56_24]|uniref:Uncharacterized protein n=1 Tax=Candidatus Kaiserbacteria bacterium RIFCSPHIGHO2_01_FULL_56_24 TaxID=1798487 RepID=A0A1F6DBZ6_9BACT|nr:MAG: hypothetical protein A2765_00450 [Candidatus Kaiserbacteria bacterium RIFCSPHIGHO2_01_FULL_56_24]